MGSLEAYLGFIILAKENVGGFDVSVDDPVLATFV